MDILAEDGERLPQGESLKGEYHLYVGAACHISYQL
jgi:hypothetical protein